MNFFNVDNFVNDKTPQTFLNKILNNVCGYTKNFSLKIFRSKHNFNALI